MPTAAGRLARVAAGRGWEGRQGARDAALRRPCCDQPASHSGPLTDSGSARSPELRRSSHWTSGRLRSREGEARPSPPRSTVASVSRAGTPEAGESGPGAPARWAPGETACREPLPVRAAGWASAAGSVPAASSVWEEEREPREAAEQPRPGQGTAQSPSRRRPEYAWLCRPPCLRITRASGITPPRVRNWAYRSFGCERVIARGREGRPGRPPREPEPACFRKRSGASGPDCAGIGCHPGLVTAP
jgi:hypothetical protein